MTLILDLDLGTLKMYLCAKSEVCMSRRSKVRARTGQTYTLLCSCDLDLDPMTLMYEIDLDIFKMCLHTKNEE